ncbi:hypothetical protein ACJJTC_013725 [Scirpophaga incertulas]
MAPNAERRQVSFPHLKYPTERDIDPKLPSIWLKGRQLQDGAEGLWRVHDGLYDLTDYINRHPGGSHWLRVTKGTDITEAFETHHLKGIAESVLPKFFVRKAKTPRNFPFTFKDDGFYKTLKAKVMAQLKVIVPKDARKKSDTVTDSLLAATVILSPLTCWAWADSWLLGATMILITGFVLSGLVTCGHNYSHRADSWRIEWRISHAMSHHLHTNSAQDIELSMFEPSLQYLPYTDKKIVARLGAFYWPLVFLFVFLFSFLMQFGAALTNIKGAKLSWQNFLIFTLPMWMWLTSGQPLLTVLTVWLGLNMVGSFFFSLYGLTAGHHAHTNFFEGDVPRQKSIDWGLYQLDTIVERVDYAEDHFRSLTRFGDHALHHFFPTLDHAELKYLYPIFLEHCKKYETQLRSTTFYGALMSKSKQLVRNRPHNFSDKSYAQKLVDMSTNLLRM